MISRYTQQLYNNGERYGYRYTFTSKGDKIPTHTHDNDTEHFVEVVKGSVIISHNSTNYLLKEGERAGPFSTAPHEIMAAEDGTIIENDYTSLDKDWLLTVPASAYESFAREVVY